MLTLAITAFDEMEERRGCGNRLLQCISYAQKHPSIREIVIVDDGSERYSELLALLSKEPKKLWIGSNVQNLGVFVNKIEAVARSTSAWVITCDSDNCMDAGYIDKVLSLWRTEKSWYCPSFAKPKFDYRELIGSYNGKTLKRIIRHPSFPCFFNTGNQVVHQKTFMKVFGKYRGQRADLLLPNWLGIQEKKRKSHYWRMVFDACDSFLLNYLWVQAGGSIGIVEGLEYLHHYATGDDGNYARSPKEKAELGEILLTQLRHLIEALQ